MGKQTFTFDKETAALLVQDAADLVIKQFVIDHKIRLDDAQMEILAQTAAKHIGIDIDYPAIADNVIKHITGLKDSTDLFLTEAVRGDLFERIKKEVVLTAEDKEKIAQEAYALLPTIKDGKDGKAGDTGKDGKDGKTYTLTGQDKTEIADVVKSLLPSLKDKNKGITSKIRADIAEDAVAEFMNSEKAVQAIVDAVVASERIVSRDGFSKKLREIKQMIKLSMKQKKSGINAGISGQDMIDEVTKILGTDWQTQPPASVLKGSGDGFVVKYDTATRVIITSGIYEVDSTLFNLDAKTTHNLTSLTTSGGVNFNYIYLDKSASGVNTPVFYDETTETVEDEAKNGRYHPTNTEDRLVGVIEKIAGAATIQPFDTQIMSNKLIRQLTLRHTLQLNRDPNGQWQTPATQSSTVVPVNAIEAAIHAVSGDAGGFSRVAWRMTEGALIQTAVINSANFMSIFETSNTNFWGPLGPSRNVQIGGADDDDNFLSAFLMGYGYTR